MHDKDVSMAIDGTHPHYTYPFTIRATTTDTLGFPAVALLCNARYTSFSRLRYNLARAFGPRRIYWQAFPAKVLLSLSPSQVVQRAQQLDAWMRWAISEPDINRSSALRDFVLGSSVIKTPEHDGDDVVVARLAESMAAAESTVALRSLAAQELKGAAERCPLPVATYLRPRTPDTCRRWRPS